MAFDLVRNLAGFPANPVAYPLTAGESFTKGDLVKISSGKITKAAAADTAVFGVMAETVTAAATGTTYGLVYDNPLNVYRAPYTGTGTPVFGATRSIATSQTVDADSATGGQVVTVLAVDSVNKTVDVVITKHILN